MHAVDPRIIQVVEQRWRQYDTIVESVRSPDEFIEQVSQLLTAWSQEDAALLAKVLLRPDGQYNAQPQIVE